MGAWERSQGQGISERKPSCACRQLSLDSKPVVLSSFKVKDGPTLRLKWPEYETIAASSQTPRIICPCSLLSLSGGSLETCAHSAPGFPGERLNLERQVQPQNLRTTYVPQGF